MRMIDKLEPIYDKVSWLEIAESYFGKSSSWMYNKIYERDVNKNGKPARFTAEEVEVLRGALVDIADKLRQTAETL